MIKNFSVFSIFTFFRKQINQFIEKEDQHIIYI